MFANESEVIVRSIKNRFSSFDFFPKLGRSSENDQKPNQNKRQIRIEKILIRRSNWCHCTLGRFQIWYNYKLRIMTNLILFLTKMAILAVKFYFNFDIRTHGWSLRKMPYFLRRPQDSVTIDAWKDNMLHVIIPTYRWKQTWSSDVL